MFLTTFQHTNELVKSAHQAPVYVSGDHLHNLFPPDPTQEASQLLSFGLIGHHPLQRSTEEKLRYFCCQNGVAYRSYHSNKHYVIFKGQPQDITSTAGTAYKNAA